MEFYILVVLAILVALNFILTFFLGVFVVRSAERTSSMIGDLANMVMIEPVAQPQPTPNEPRPRTWDEKYEDELDAFQRRLRQSTNLADLDTGPALAIPPATPPTQGMTIVDRE
jgi:hypothetical protein